MAAGRLRRKSIVETAKGRLVVMLSYNSVAYLEAEPKLEPEIEAWFGDQCSSAVVGKPIRYEELTPDGWRAALMAGAP
jgi:hypothetical protein